MPPPVAQLLPRRADEQRVKARSSIHRLRGAQGGFGLIEVIVSAAVLLTVTVATLSLIDGSNRTQVESRSRSVTADLAEQDQERMRSSRVLDLANIDQTRNVTVGGVPYAVRSQSRWLRDATGAEPTCTDKTGQAEYMQITSTVSPVNAVAGVKPQAISSLVAPEVGTYGAGQGTLIVKVTDRSGAGQAGIPVAIAPAGTTPNTGSDTTDSNGCAVFNYFPVGAYDVTFSKPGYINTLGQSSVKISGQINSGVVSSTTPVLYDQPAAIKITATTNNTATAGNRQVATLKVPINTPQDAVTVGNSGIGNASNSFFFTGTPDANFQLPATGISAPGLFPFIDGDTVYSGRCTNSDPSTAGGGTTYYQSNPGQVSLTPGSTSSVAVFQPWLKVTVKNAANNAYGTGATVYAKEACGSIYKLGATDSGGIAQESIPWGKYQICATDGTYEVRSAVSAVTVSGFTPVSPAALKLTTTGTKATCQT
jgi:Tfp pilus assembly protein PilV